ncbi:type II toxin-antitoxin system HicB family antitoxin [Tistrella mobilis]|uniref:type II toxin-antitoxin system HicB family antitoxin n=1 Tax=Tistrella mobilis TaxID=171437 RepID=UPI00355638A4
MSGGSIAPLSDRLEIDGETATVTLDPETRMLRGAFVGLSGGADFYATNIPDLIEEGRRSLAVYLGLCREKGIEPRPKVA